jgi:hypothetical protein
MARFERTFAEDTAIINEIAQVNEVGDERGSPIPGNELTSNTIAGTGNDALVKPVSFFSSIADLKVKVPSIKWNQGWLQTCTWLHFVNNSIKVDSKYYVNVLRKTPGVVEVIGHEEPKTPSSTDEPPTTKYPISNFKKKA